MTVCQTHPLKQRKEMLILKGSTIWDATVNKCWHLIESLDWSLFIWKLSWLAEKIKSWSSKAQAGNNLILSANYLGHSRWEEVGKGREKSGERERGRGDKDGRENSGEWGGGGGEGGGEKSSPIYKFIYTLIYIQLCVRLRWSLMGQSRPVCIASEKERGKRERERVREGCWVGEWKEAPLVKHRERERERKSNKFHQLSIRHSSFYGRI